MFNIVSQQSTARPGCIIELDIITNQVIPTPLNRCLCISLCVFYIHVLANMNTCLCCVVNVVCLFLQCGSNTQLLHVFQEDFILGYKPHEDIPDFNTNTFPSAEG